MHQFENAGKDPKKTSVKLKNCNLGIISKLETASLYVWCSFDCLESPVFCENLSINVGPN